MTVIPQASPSGTTAKNLVLGPWPASLVLSALVSSQALHNVVLEVDGNVIGLDTIPFETSADIDIFGEIELNDISVLNDRGLEWLSNDLCREHDTSKQALQEHLNQHCLRLVLYLRSSPAGLPKYYTEHLTLTIPSLNLVTYRFTSMNVKSYELSRQFLGRWRIYHLFMQFKDDPECKKTDHSFEDFINYCLHYHEQVVQYQRFNTSKWSPKLKLHHVSHSEPARIFAEHAQWFMWVQRRDAVSLGENVIDGRTLEEGIKLQQLLNSNGNLQLVPKPSGLVGDDASQGRTASEPNHPRGPSTSREKDTPNESDRMEVEEELTKAQNTPETPNQTTQTAMDVEEAPSRHEDMLVLPTRPATPMVIDVDQYEIKQEKKEVIDIESDSDNSIILVGMNIKATPASKRKKNAKRGGMGSANVVIVIDSD